MWQPEDFATTKMCPKRSQFGTVQNCLTTQCMAWRREEDHNRNRNSGVAYGYCSEYSEPKNHNSRKV